jgi:hypothetical protein
MKEGAVSFTAAARVTPTPVKDRRHGDSEAIVVPGCVRHFDLIWSDKLEKMWMT